MNTKTKTGIALMALVFGIALSPILSNEAEAEAANILRPAKVIVQGDLTAPMDDKPFGGDVVGNYYIQVRDDRATISVRIDAKASQGTVYEGWLVDADSGVKTSFGIIQNSEHRQMGVQLTTSVENNFNNDLVVITEEPVVDTDPAPHTPVGGAVLGNPFGQ